MITVELKFTSSPARLAARPAHRAVLEQLHSAGSILGAGPWSDDSGAMLIFRLGREQVKQILKDDPYYSTDGVTIASIREWTPVVGAS